MKTEEPSSGTSMAGNQTAHITVTYWDGGDEITGIYAVNEAISRGLDRDMQMPTGRALKDWLDDKGCQLDSSGGPAFVFRDADGATVEKYYRDGKLHREDGPAFVWRKADGSTEERYYRDGKLVETEHWSSRCQTQCR